MLDYYEGLECEECGCRGECECECEECKLTEEEDEESA